MANTTIPTLTIAAQAAASRQALTDAEALVTRREQDAHAAATHVKSIELAWDRGDDSVPAEDLSRAKDQASRAERLLSAAKSGVRTAQRKLINDNPDLAAAVSDALGGSIIGLPLTIALTMPAAAEPMPVAYLVQDRSSAPDTIDGTISGAVTLLLRGPAWMTKPEADDVAGRLRDGGVYLRHKPSVSTSTRGKTVEHKVVLDVRQASAAVPVISADPRDWRVSRFAQLLASEVTHASKPSERSNPAFQAFVSDPEIVGVSIASDGTRSTTVRFGFRAEPGSNGPRTAAAWTEDRSRARLMAMPILQRQVGTFAEGLGRLTLLTPESAGTNQYTVTTVFTSRTAD